MNRKIIILAIFIIIVIPTILTLITQQRSINAYKNESKQYNEQIEEELEKQNSLNETLSNLNTTNYVEEMARDKLDMYLPNERVYIDEND